MDNGCTRRDFLKLSGLGATALGCVGAFGLLTRDGHADVVRCARCHAVSHHGHTFNEGRISGLFCPNCGVELRTLRHQVDTLPAPREFRNRNKHIREGTWDCVQVPFPNPDLVRETSKPAINLSKLTF